MAPSEGPFDGAGYPGGPEGGKMTPERTQKALFASFADSLAFPELRLKQGRVATAPEDRNSPAQGDVNRVLEEMRARLREVRGEQIESTNPGAAQTTQAPTQRPPSRGVVGSGSLCPRSGGSPQGATRTPSHAEQFREADSPEASHPPPGPREESQGSGGDAEGVKTAPLPLERFGGTEACAPTPGLLPAERPSVCAEKPDSEDFFSELEALKEQLAARRRIAGSSPQKWGSKGLVVPSGTKADPAPGSGRGSLAPGPQGDPAGLPCGRPKPANGLTPGSEQACSPGEAGGFAREKHTGVFAPPIQQEAAGAEQTPRAALPRRRLGTPLLLAEGSQSGLTPRVAAWEQASAADALVRRGVGNLSARPSSSGVFRRVAPRPQSAGGDRFGKEPGDATAAWSDPMLEWANQVLRKAQQSPCPPLLEPAVPPCAPAPPDADASGRHPRRRDPGFRDPWPSGVSTSRRRTSSQDRQTLHGIPQEPGIGTAGAPEALRPCGSGPEASEQQRRQERLKAELHREALAAEAREAEVRRREAEVERARSGEDMEEVRRRVRRVAEEMRRNTLDFGFEDLVDKGGATATTNHGPEKWFSERHGTAAGEERPGATGFGGQRDRPEAAPSPRCQFGARGFSGARGGDAAELPRGPRNQAPPGRRRLPNTRLQTSRAPLVPLGGERRFQDLAEYEAAWRAWEGRLEREDGDSSSGPALNFGDIPWPVFAPFAAYSGGVCGVQPGEAPAAAKRKFANALRRWHPDKWHDALIERVSEADREKVKARVKEVAQRLVDEKAELLDAAH